MFKRIIIVLAVAATLLACGPAGPGGTTGTGTQAPVESVEPSDALPTEESSASPS